MALTLNAVPGDKSANSYVTLAAAASYFEGRYPSTAWDDDGKDARSDASKNVLLVNATRDINGMLAEWRVPYFNGRLEDYQQALTWPWYGGALNWSGTADSGTTTTLADTDIDDRYAANDARIVGGSVLIYDTTDDAAPKLELSQVTAYDPATSAFTFGALTAAVGSGDSYKFVGPVPSWLVEAVCEQAYYLAGQRGVEMNDWRRGVASKGGTAGGGNTALRKPSPHSNVCQLAAEIVARNAYLGVRQ